MPQLPLLQGHRGQREDRPKRDIPHCGHCFVFNALDENMAKSLAESTLTMHLSLHYVAVGAWQICSL